MKNDKIIAATETELFKLWQKKRLANAGQTYDAFLASCIRKGIEVTSMSEEEQRHLAKAY
jgi:hypothetical protein